jgi:hypothetical protein
MSARVTRSSVVLGVYAALTGVITWPVAKDLTTALPQDLGDPLLNV